MPTSPTESSLSGPHRRAPGRHSIIPLTSVDMERSSLRRPRISTSISRTRALPVEPRARPTVRGSGQPEHSVANHDAPYRVGGLIPVLRAIGVRERMDLLGGRLDAGPEARVWRHTAELPAFATDMEPQL